MYILIFVLTWEEKNNIAKVEIESGEFEIDGDGSLQQPEIWDEQVARLFTKQDGTVELKERRIESGKIKAEQIRKTGAKIVATPCHNCIDQIMELNQEYKLGAEIKTVAETVADALVN